MNLPGMNPYRPHPPWSTRCTGPVIIHNIDGLARPEYIDPDRPSLNPFKESTRHATFADAMQDVARRGLRY